MVQRLRKEPFLFLIIKLTTLYGSVYGGQIPLRFCICKTEPLRFTLDQQKMFNGLVLYAKTLDSSEEIDRTFYSLARFHKTLQGFSTAMQNEKWFSKSCRTENGSANLHYFFQSSCSQNFSSLAFSYR